MSRRANVVVLCEDLQHATFARRFLEKAGWDPRRLRVKVAPAARGAADRWVIENFPAELAAYRRNRNRVAEALVVLLDADRIGTEGRLRDLAAACGSKGEPRADDDRVAVFVPAWRIETWFAWLDGAEVDESRRDYPKLERESECVRHVERLDELCRSGRSERDPPSSLKSACEEYRARLR